MLNKELLLCNVKEPTLVLFLLHYSSLENVVLYTADDIRMAVTLVNGENKFHNIKEVNIGSANSWSRFPNGGTYKNFTRKSSTRGYVIDLSKDSYAEIEPD